MLRVGSKGDSSEGFKGNWFCQFFFTSIYFVHCLIISVLIVSKPFLLLFLIAKVDEYSGLSCSM